MGHRPFATFAFISFAATSIFVTGCTASSSDEEAPAESTEEAVRRGTCTLAPKSREILGNPLLSSQVPPFSSVAWSSDRMAHAVGGWDRETSASLASAYDPNRWASSGHLTIQAPAGGSYVEWTIPVPNSDVGADFSIYAYIPGAARATKALYRVYDGKSSSAVNTIEINQDRARNAGAAVTLAGKNYSAPGWVFLGKQVLHRNARVSLDASASQGKLVADSIVAVRWGCRENDLFRALTR
jgi:hypothetical protein